MHVGRHAHSPAISAFASRSRGRAPLCRSPSPDGLLPLPANIACTTSPSPRPSIPTATTHRKPSELMTEQQAYRYIRNWLGVFPTFGTAWGLVSSKLSTMYSSKPPLAHIPRRVYSLLGLYLSPSLFTMATEKDADVMNGYRTRLIRFIAARYGDRTGLVRRLERDWILATNAHGLTWPAARAYLSTLQARPQRRTMHVLLALMLKKGDYDNLPKLLDVCCHYNVQVKPSEIKRCIDACLDADKLAIAAYIFFRYYPACDPDLGNEPIAWSIFCSLSQHPNLDPDTFQFVFEQIHPDVPGWSIRFQYVYCLLRIKKSTADAVDFFRKHHIDRKLSPNTYSMMLKDLALCGDLDAIMEVWAMVRKHVPEHIYGDQVLMSAACKALCICGRADLALRLVDDTTNSQSSGIQAGYAPIVANMAYTDIWNAEPLVRHIIQQGLVSTSQWEMVVIPILKAYANLNWVIEAERFLEWAMNQNPAWIPSLCVWTHLGRCYSSNRREFGPLYRLWYIAQHILKLPYDRDYSPWSASVMLDQLGFFKSREHVVRYMEQLVEKNRQVSRMENTKPPIVNANVCNSYIEALLRCDAIELALKTVMTMKETYGIDPELKTFVTALQPCRSKDRGAWRTCVAFMAEKYPDIYDEMSEDYLLYWLVC
ncbi:hypothetical protein SeLEV6574_g01923 [Synchytrium endobioticum]|uniref:Pentacotripeptide-repeat region of PRORP domain-containing protein n=1 Tax=Synchytrium endobioticum TaxID=286115 RepID=A0A507DB94_9FUNG|nr:hypothetical protein SeLEV6574_g01923 [Synchytrium endobioticum]